MLCIFDLSDGSSCVINGFNLRSLSTLQAKYKYVKKHDSAIIHIFYVSLNVLRPTFFSIYNLPFLLSPNIRKIRVKVGPKTNYFSYILSSCTNRIAVFNNFFHWYVANKGTNKTVPVIFFFPNIFWIIYF